jgi:hypothetical protein
MSIPIPKLDTLTYQDLVEQARSQIPLLCPDWTDYNATDPGIILIELLAWLTELSLYQVDQIPDRTTETFLQLLNGADFVVEKDLQTSIQETLLKLHEPYRAVTPLDYEQLILQNWKQVQRVCCLPNYNLEQSDQTALGHLSLIIVPALSELANSTTLPLAPPALTPILSQAILEFLDDRRLLTTHPHIYSPHYVPVNLGATLYLEEGVNPTHVLARSIHAVANFFHPVMSWKFGRTVYLSEVYQLFDQIPGVDYVEAVTLNHAEAEVPLKAHELVAIALTAENLQLYARSGGSEKQWQQTQAWQLQHCFFYNGDTWKLWHPTLHLLQ